MQNISGEKIFIVAAAFVICTMSICVTAYNINSNNNDKLILSKATNPALVKCAIDTSSANQSAFCLEVAKHQ